MKRTYSRVQLKVWEYFRKHGNGRDEAAYCDFSRPILAKGLQQSLTLLLAGRPELAPALARVMQIGEAVKAGQPFELGDLSKYPDVQQLIAAARDGGHMPMWAHDTCYASALALFIWKFRPVTHYFLEEGVADFCVGAVKQGQTKGYVKLFPDVPDVAMPTCASPFKSTKPGRMLPGAFAVHFPARERRASVMFLPRFEMPLAVFPMLVERYAFAALDGEDVILMPVDGGKEDLETDSADEATRWLTRFTCGFSLYVDAFPDTVVPAVDSEIHEASHYRGSRTYVRAHACVETERRGLTSPHWVPSFFRTLVSEFYTVKRGQTILVKGHMRGTKGGEAKEVLADAPAPVKEATVA